MVFWPFRGILRRLTEPAPGRTDHVEDTGLPTRQLGRAFRRSLHLFVVDTGCDNAANFAIAGLEAPQYNTHRFGIYFADSPRHADLLIVLGPPLPQLVGPLRATLSQVPEPYGVLLVDDFDRSDGTWWRGVIDEERILGRLSGVLEPLDIFAALLEIQRGDARVHGRYAG